MPHIVIAASFRISSFEENFGLEPDDDSPVFEYHAKINPRRRLRFEKELVHKAVRRRAFAAFAPDQDSGNRIEGQQSDERALERAVDRYERRHGKTLKLPGVFTPKNRISSSYKIQIRTLRRY